MIASSFERIFNGQLPKRKEEDRYASMLDGATTIGHRLDRALAVSGTDYEFLKNDYINY
jgi:hypothetical protein